MEFEVISYPEEIKPNTEYHVEVKVTPDSLGWLTEDRVFFKEEEVDPPIYTPFLGSPRRVRMTFIHRNWHFNRIGIPYTLYISIKPQHVSKLTELDMVLAIETFNGVYDGLLSHLFGGKVLRIHYAKEGDTYYTTGETSEAINFREGLY